MSDTKKAPTKAAAKKAAAPAKADTSHLVEMTKGGETLSVHPSTVAAHRAAGWS